MGQGPQTFFGTHGNQLPTLSGVHGFKDLISRELITVSTRKCLGALCHPNIHFPPQQRPAGADGNAPRTPDESDEQVGGIVNTPETLNTAD